MDTFLFFHFFLTLIIGVPLILISLLFLVSCGLIFLFSKLRHKDNQKYHRNLIIAAIIIIVLVPLSFFINHDLSEEFLTRKSNKVFSPDHAHYVRIEESDCGATCDFDTSANIYNTNRILSFSVILNSWTGNSQSVFATNGSPDSMSASWINNKALKVEFSNCEKIYGQDKSWHNIKIVYEGKCSENY